MNAHESSATATPQGWGGDVRVFTLEQARQALPYVQRIAADIVETYPRLLEVQGRIEASEEPDAGDQRAHDELRRRLSELVDELQAVGVELKDFERGLVDFPAEHEGRPVYLCWQHGESDIGHWHEVDAGFPGRQGIDTFNEQPARG